MTANEPAPSPELDRALAAKSVREPAARAIFLAAVREYGKDGTPFTVERLEGLMRIEEHFQTLLLYDQLEFLRGAGPATPADRDFALNVQRICLEAANGFQRFLRNRNDWARTRDTVDLLFRVTGLALNTIHSFVKWGYFLNETGRTVPWKQLHALFSLAEADGYSQVPFALYPSQPSFKPSVQSLYLRTLVLDLLNAGNLSKVQAEIADGWFSSWCGEYALDTEYSTRAHLFYVDLASDSGLHLMRRDGHRESVRYVRADGLKSQIEEVQAGLRHGRLYAGHGAGAVFPIEEHVALLALVEKLYASIVAGSENRIEERTAFEDREVEVVPGLARVLERLKRGPAAPAPDADGPATVSAEMVEISPSGLSLTPIAAPAPVAPSATDPEVQTWRVHDLSSKGYGLVVDKGSADSLLLGGLIGLRNQETGGWILGSVVRKLANRVRGEMLAGVEVLSFRPLPVALRPDGGEAVDAIYLPGLDTNGKLDALLMPAGDFATGKSFALSAGGATYRIRLNRITKKGADWIKVRYEIESRA